MGQNRQLRIFVSIAAIAAVAGPAAGTASAEPSAPREATLVAAGDIACPPRAPETASTCRQRRTASLVGSLAPDAIATLGDAQYEHALYADYVGGFGPSWGVFRSLTRPVAGNHEYMSSADRRTAPGHFRYFGPAAGDPRKGYYSYELGSWTVLALNTGALERTRRSRRLPDDCFPVSCARGSAQLAWLRRVLDQLPPERCVLAYWHHPRFSSGLPGSFPELRPAWQTLYAHGAEIVLSGHAHSYERFAPMDARGRIRRGGVRQFVVGTGGADRAHRARRVIAGSQAFDNTSFGVLELRLRPRRYEFRFVSEHGQTLDRGRGKCHS
jgi:acid phosphatase type 7